MKKTITYLVTITVLFLSVTTRATVVYTPMDVTADQTTTWSWFPFGLDADGFGLWVNPGVALRLETYLNPVIGYDDGGLTFLTAVPYGEEINASSAWVTPTIPTYINDATHTQLNGTTCYVAVQLVTSEGAVHYGWMQLMVAADGLSVTLLGMAYEDQPETPLLAGVIDRQVIYESTVFTEDLIQNNGSFSSEVPISLLGVEFSVTSGAFTENTHYTVENLPAGLSLEITAVDATHASIFMSGQTAAHSVSDTVNNLTISFLDAAFVGATAAEVMNSVKSDLFIKFFDPYHIIYEDFVDMVCGIGGWAPFGSPYFDNWFGVWNDGTDMRLETYGNDVIGQIVAGSSYVTPLDFDTPINTESEWVTTGVWPNEPYINRSTYTVWNGQQKYAGIKLMVGDAELYGWVNMEVSADGMTVTVYDWAFNSCPQGPIKAGQMDNTGMIEQVKNNIIVSPNPFNDQIRVSLDNKVNTTMTVEILNLCGEMVFHDLICINGQKEFTVQTHDLTPGVYILRIIYPGEVLTQKVVCK